MGGRGHQLLLMKKFIFVITLPSLLFYVLWQQRLKCFFGGFMSFWWFFVENIVIKDVWIRMSLTQHFTFTLQPLIFHRWTFHMNQNWLKCIIQTLFRVSKLRAINQNWYRFLQCGWFLFSTLSHRYSIGDDSFFQEGWDKVA